MTKKQPTVEKQFQGQRDGEEVVLVFHQHPLVMRKALIFGLLIILLGVVPLDFPQIYSQPGLADVLFKIAIIIPIFIFAYWFYRWIGWYYTVYIATNQRLIEISQKGLFDRAFTEWQLNKILNINYRIGGLQAVLFGYGDISVQTVVGDFQIPKVHHPAKIHARLQEVLQGGGSAGAISPADSSRN
jgi:hypothetical protein